MAFFNLLCKYFIHANIDIKVHPEYKGKRAKKKKNTLCILSMLKLHFLYIEFRRILIHSILCTDMGCHGDYLQEIRNAGTDNTLVICTAIMKCADISNCVSYLMQGRRYIILTPYIDTTIS